MMYMNDYEPGALIQHNCITDPLSLTSIVGASTHTPFNLENMR